MINHSVISHSVILDGLNPQNAADVSRRQVQNVKIFTKNVKIMKFGDDIWNYHKKCIRTSTNMPSIGSVFMKICVEM